MIAVACDNEKDSVFRETVEAARSIEDFSHQHKTFLQRGAGRNPVHFPEDLVSWIRHADAARRFRENEGLDFDIVTATTSPWRGLRLVAIGSNKLKSGSSLSCGNRTVLPTICRQSRCQVISNAYPFGAI